MGMQRARLLAVIAAVILVALPLPVYITISGLSLMAFDTAGDNLWQWLVVGSAVGTSVVVPITSLISAILLIRRGKTWPGLVVSLIPLVVLGAFWIWISQQSFS